MAFDSFFNALPFSGYFDNGMPTFPMGGAYGAVPVQKPPPFSMPAAPLAAGGGGPAQGSSNILTNPPVTGVPPSVSDLLGPIAGIPNTAPSTQTPLLPIAAQGQPNVSSWESGLAIPDSGPALGGYAPIGTPSVSASESGIGIPDSGGTQVGAPSFSGGYQLSPSDIASMSQTPSIPYYSSITNTPTFNTGNLEQAGVNVASNFVPALGILAGIGQGFNMFGEADKTGNPITDAIGTAGPIQSTTADIANWINRQFGGAHMPNYVSTDQTSNPGPAPMGSPIGLGLNWGGNPGTFAQQQQAQMFGYDPAGIMGGSISGPGIFDISGAAGGVGDSNNPNRLAL